MRLPGTRSGAPVDWLLVGLGNPGAEYDGTRHNIGFEIARELARRWDLGKPKSRYRGLLSEGRAGVGAPRDEVGQLIERAADEAEEVVRDGMPPS